MEHHLAATAVPRTQGTSLAETAKVKRVFVTFASQTGSDYLTQELRRHLEAADEHLEKISRLAETFLEGPTFSDWKSACVEGRLFWRDMLYSAYLLNGEENESLAETRIKKFERFIQIMTPMVNMVKDGFALSKMEESNKQLAKQYLDNQLTRVHLADSICKKGGDTILWIIWKKVSAALGAKTKSQTLGKELPLTITENLNPIDSWRASALQDLHTFLIGEILRITYDLAFERGPLHDALGYHKKCIEEVTLNAKHFLTEINSATGFRFLMPVGANTDVSSQVLMTRIKATEAALQKIEAIADEIKSVKSPELLTEPLWPACIRKIAEMSFSSLEGILDSLDQVEKLFALERKTPAIAFVQNSLDGKIINIANHEDFWKRACSSIDADFLSEIMKMGLEEMPKRKPHYNLANMTRLMEAIINQGGRESAFAVVIDLAKMNGEWQKMDKEYALCAFLAKIVASSYPERPADTLNNQIVWLTNHLCSEARTAEKCALSYRSEISEEGLNKEESESKLSLVITALATTLLFQRMADASHLEAISAEIRSRIENLLNIMRQNLGGAKEVGIRPSRVDDTGSTISGDLAIP